MKRWRVIPVVIVLGAVVVCLGYWNYVSHSPNGQRAEGESNDPPAAGNSTDENVRDGIFALGRIEPRDGIIKVSSVPGERVQSLSVSQGSQVKQGEELGVLDGYKLAEANYRLAQNDLRRLEGLSADLVSQQQLERQQLLVEQAQAELDRTLIVAPTDGTVLRTLVRPGETIGREPVVQLADLDRMVVVAEVFEADVKHIEIGQQAAIHSRAFHPPYDEHGLTGKVTQIGRVIGTPAIESLDPLASADRHVVEVRIELDPMSTSEAAKLINLQVDVRIDTET